MKKTKPKDSEAKKSAVLIYCPSNIILAGILKDLETGHQEDVALEKLVKKITT